MVAVRLCVLLAIVACGEPAASPQPAWPEKPAEPVATETPRATRTDEVAPPKECGKRTWPQCLEAARSLIAQTPDLQERGVTLYKLLCAEGDRRRCFDGGEGDRGCHVDGLVFACHELARLYRDGIATCPRDQTCAELLDQMACRGGEKLACAR